MKKSLLLAGIALVLCSCGSETSQDNHEWVDLGLPSGTKWATCNVGASSPEEHGDYFAWGETSPKSNYTEKTSKTYGVEVGDISGNSQYDAARANWRGEWRMPTAEEWEELCDNCDWEWETQNGHDGYKVTGPNGNSIFIPAANRLYGDHHSYSGSMGNYWSSTPHGGNVNKAYDMGFLKGYKSMMGSEDRYFGCSVRPVMD